MIAIYDNYLEDNKDLIDVISNISEGKKPKLGPDEVLVVKGKEEEVIDIDDLRKYLKKGWELNEATLTKNQQDMVKDVVDNDLDLEEFEKKYGKKDGKSVAFAVATNMVKKKEGITEEELDEKKSSTGYELYHKSFSAAMQHAYEFAKSKGHIVDVDEIDDKVALGPKKPSKGKTNSYSLKAGRKTAHIQVFNMNDKSYELNMYIEEVELEEGYFKIDIPQMPPAYMESPSAASVKAALRGILKSDALKEISIEKVSKSEMKKQLRDMAKDGGETKEEEVELEEGFSQKEIKMAIGIAEDESGNMTGATKKIEKIKKGLSDHPQVKDALKKQNEDKDMESTPHLMGDSHWEATNELVNYLRNLTPGENPETKLDEDAKMAKKSDDGLMAMLHQMLSLPKAEQSRASIQHQTKRIRKELKKRGLKEDSTELDEAHGDNIEHLRDILKGKSAKALKFSNGTMKVDSFSASAIISVYDKVNKMNQDMLRKLINGSKEDFIKASDIAFKVIQKQKK